MLSLDTWPRTQIFLLVLFLLAPTVFSVVIWSTAKDPSRMMLAGSSITKLVLFPFVILSGMVAWLFTFISLKNIAILLWVASFFLPVGRNMPGWQLFLASLVFFPLPFVPISALTNFILVIYLFKKPEIIRRFGHVILLLSSILNLFTVWFAYSTGPTPSPGEPKTGPPIAIIAWCASFIILTIDAFIEARRT